MSDDRTHFWSREVVEQNAPAVDTAATPAAVDTAAIRRAYSPPEGCGVSAEIGLILRLADALDAAQARADDLAAEVERLNAREAKNLADYRWQVDQEVEARKAAEARATAAESEVERLTARGVPHFGPLDCARQLRALEAQVTAVRALCERMRPAPVVAVAEVVSALDRAALDSAGTPAALDPQPAEGRHEFERSDDKNGTCGVHVGGDWDGWWSQPCGQRREHPVHDVPTPPAEGGGR